MEDKIIARFLEKGKLLTPEALDYIKSKKLENILIDIPDVVVTKASIANPISIIKNLTEKKTEVTAEDFAAFCKTKYERIREIILQRTQKDFVSLNKLDTARQEIFVVGIVKDIRKKEKHIVDLEDVTGTAQIIMDDTGDLELDDVVAIRATTAGKILFGQQIIYPDIPLRKPATGFGLACFISDLHLNEAPKTAFEKFLGWLEKQAIDLLFVAGDIGEKETFEELISKYCAEKKVFVIPGEIDSEGYPQTPLKFSWKNIISLSNPAMVDVGGVKILLIHEMSLSMLKKRYLGKQKQIMHSEYLVVDDVPDIVHAGHTHEPSVTNYKSVTIINSGSLLTNFKPIIIDLATRDAVQANWE